MNGLNVTKPEERLSETKNKNIGKQTKTEIDWRVENSVAENPLHISEINQKRIRS